MLNAYAIVFAALLVPAGRLADHYGRRLFLLAGVVAFTLASVLCAAAPVLAVLVLGRVIQAAGAAMIVPSSLGLLLAAFPRRQHTLAVGIWAGVAAVAASSGAPVGGLLVAVDWRLFFVAFSVWLLVTVLFLQDEWHYSALRAGLAIAPGPLTAAVFAINSGRIAGRSGLAQAPLFAAASSLQADRATTGSAVLNMSRQLGSAVTRPRRRRRRWRARHRARRSP